MQYNDIIHIYIMYIIILYYEQCCLLLTDTFSFLLGLLHVYSSLVKLHVYSIPMQYWGLNAGSQTCQTILLSLSHNSSSLNCKGRLCFSLLSSWDYRPASLVWLWVHSSLLLLCVCVFNLLFKHSIQVFDMLCSNPFLGLSSKSSHSLPLFHPNHTYSFFVKTTESAYGCQDMYSTDVELSTSIQQPSLPPL